jgi:hypothetical protein
MARDRMLAINAIGLLSIPERKTPSSPAIKKTAPIGNKIFGRALTCWVIPLYLFLVENLDPKSGSLTPPFGSRPLSSL